MNVHELRDCFLDAVMKVESAEWTKARIEFDFAPFINAGNRAGFYFSNAAGELLPLHARFDNVFNFELLNFFCEHQADMSFNKIIFSCERGDSSNAVLEFRLDEKIIEEFLNNLPKSKRGKTIPWYQNEGEISRLKEVLEIMRSPK